MRQVLRYSWMWTLVALVATSAFAQQRTLRGTVVDVDEARGRIQIELDDASASRMTIETDSVATTYTGFGTVIAGKPEIFTGSAGLSNVRLGDRVDVRSAMQGGVNRAESIALIGRDIAAAPVGVGQTRPPTSVSSVPPSPSTTGTATTSRIEGTIRQINDEEGRLVIVTSDRRMITVRTYRNTPVYYRGEAYRVSNLEVGDRIAVQPDTRDTGSGEITARRIDVTASVQDAGESSGSSTTVTVIEGRVTRVETQLDYAYLDDGGREIRVDMREAVDANRDVVRARDLHVGDRVEISGSYNRTGDMFVASTVRYADGSAPRDNTDSGFTRYGVVTMTGTITQTLEDGPTLSFRDRDTNGVERIWVTTAFVVRTKGNTYITAESLRVNDTAVIDAFRDPNGNLIAQTIRLRNR